MCKGIYDTLGKKFIMVLNRKRGNAPSNFSRKENQSSLKAPQTINLIKLLPKKNKII